MQLMKLDHPDMHKKELADEVGVSRYLTLEEFLGILNRKFKFTSMKKLREYDQHEFKMEPLRIDEETISRENSILDRETIEVATGLLREKDWSQHFFCSCWTSEVDESMALWKIFANSGKGIKIKSTVGAVKSSIVEKYWPVPVFAKEVEYNDHKIHENFVGAIFGKRNEFRYESEVRFCTQIDFPHGKDYQSVWIDPIRLVQSVVVGPEIDWATSEIIEVCGRFNLDKKLVSRSNYVI